MSLARWTHPVWWLLPPIVALLLASPSVRLPGDSLGIRRFRTPPLDESLRLGQTFAMTGDGLHAIEVRPVAAAVGITGDVRFELYEVRDGQLFLVRTVEVLAEEVLLGPSYRFEFPPISDSKDRTYRLDLVSAPAQGLAFWATRGDRYEGGSMHANGRDRWADLAFRAHAPAPPIWNRLLMLRATHPARVYLVMAALSAIWLLLGFGLRALTKIPPESAQADSPRTA